MAVLIAPTAVEWFAEASPKLHTAIASAGHGDGDAELAGPGDGERDADRARQVRGDRRGLRNDVEVVAAEHLVPAAGDRFVGRGDHPEQHVAQRIAAVHLRARARKKAPER